MTTAMEKKINPAVLARWREQVADFTTGVERVGNTVFVFYLVEGDGLVVRVLGNTTVHLYEATNTLTANAMTAPTWPLANEQWAEVRRLFDAGQVEEARHFADSLVIWEAIEADEDGSCVAAQEDVLCLWQRP